VGSDVMDTGGEVAQRVPLVSTDAAQRRVLKFHSNDMIG